MPLAVDSPAMAAPGDIFTRILLVMLAIGGLATGCRSTESAAPATSLIGTSWLAKEIDEQRVLERVESTLSFDSAQRITGQAACNRYFGALELGEGTIRLKPAGTTRMACAPAVMDQESRFLAALGAASAFRREAGKLVLLDETGRVRVRLTPRGPGRGATAPPRESRWHRPSKGPGAGDGAGCDGDSVVQPGLDVAASGPGDADAMTPGS